MTDERYAGVVIAAMAQSPDGPLSIRQVAAAVGCSYEHMRKLVSGEPVASKGLNFKLCKVLRLDVDTMWQLAQREKAEKKFGPVFRQLSPPPDRRMSSLWRQLSPVDQERVLQFAQALVTAGSRHRIPR